MPLPLNLPTLWFWFLMPLPHGHLVILMPLPQNRTLPPLWFYISLPSRSLSPLTCDAYIFLFSRCRFNSNQMYFDLLISRWFCSFPSHRCHSDTHRPHPLFRQLSVHYTSVFISWTIYGGLVFEPPGPGPLTRRFPLQCHGNRGSFCRWVLY